MLTPQRFNNTLETLKAEIAYATTVFQRIIRLTDELSGGSLLIEKPAKGTRTLSAAGRKAISEATKRRWATKKAEEAAIRKPVKSARKMSVAGRKAIAAGQRKRWAKAKEVAKAA